MTNIAELKTIALDNEWWLKTRSDVL